MQKNILIIFFTLNCKLIFAALPCDTSGVYESKNDFTNNTFTVWTFNKIKIRPIPILNNFSVNEEAAPFKIKLPDGTKKVLKPGTFYGFKTEGIKFIYMNYLHEYLAVLSDKTPLYLFVRKNVHFSGITAFADETFYFSTVLDDSLKEFNIENIKISFGEDTQTTRVLAELLEKIKAEGLNGEMHKKQFFKCKNVVEVYLSKL